MEINCPICESYETKKVDRYYGYTYPFNNRSALIKCCNCTLVFMFPTPTDIQLDQFYNNYWYNDDPVQNYNKIHHRIQFQSRLDYLLKNNLQLSNKKILDFGAGHCLFNEVLIKNNVSNIDYNAVETDNNIIKKMKNNGICIKNNIKEFKTQKFDMILLFHILEHVLSPIDLITELSNYLNQDGYIFIEVPNQDHVWKKNLEPHVLFFNINSLSKLLELSGFEVIAIHSCGQDLNLLKMEKTKLKMFKNRIGRLLRKYKVLNKKKEPIVNRSSDEIKESLKVNEFGDNSQWLRLIAKRSI